MSSSVTWFRWYRGRVWHVGFAQDAAACGSERPADAETVGERAPVNARVCGDCVTSALHLHAMAQVGQMGDPRGTYDPWAAGEELLIAQGGVRAADGVVDAPIVAADEWPCGSCGHSNLDHDYGDGTCTDADDAFDVAAGESLGPCECRGLTRAG